jgi:hypothetical protein
MVQIINDPYSGNVGGRLGVGIGQGLSAQLPKDLERVRLSQGLKRIGETPSANPIERASDLVGLPGGAELLPTLMPFLQQLQARQQFANEQKNQTQGAPTSSTGTFPQDMNNLSPSTPVSPALTEDDVGEIPLGERTRGANFLQPATQQEKNQRAIRLLETQPARFQTVEQALQQVENEEATRLAGDTAFQTRQDMTSKTFNDLLEKELQKAGQTTYADISGDLQRKFLNRALTEVAAGANPTQTANKYAKEALRLAQSTQTLRDTGAAKWYSTLPSTNRSKLNTIRDHFKEVGALEDFANLAQETQNLSPHYARNLAYPLSDNKELNNLIAREKGRPGGRGIGSRQKEIILANEIAKNIKPTDSLFTIGLQLNRKGLDDMAVINALRESTDFRERLNARQVQELEKYKPVDRTAGDIWLYTMSGMDPLLEVE